MDEAKLGMRNRRLQEIAIIMYMIKNNISLKYKTNEFSKNDSRYEVRKCSFMSAFSPLVGISSSFSGSSATEVALRIETKLHNIMSLKNRTQESR